MIVIQGYLRTAPENAAKLREAAAPLIETTRQEPGCIAYAYAEDIGEPGLFHIVERWADEASMAAHAKAPHLAAFLAALPAIGISGVRIARYDAPSEQIVFGA